MTRVRRAGHGLTPAGEVTWWSVAEGRRGRRWRESVAGPGGLRHALLLETDPAGRFLHLELATPSGLLTLHPEPDGTLHGNALEAGGLRHLEGLAWDPAGVVDVAGSAVAAAAAAHRLRNAVDAGASVTWTTLWITGELTVGVGPQRIERGEADTWRIAGGDGIRVDADALPVLRDGRSWPLDRDPDG
jgi:hypothetical protein